MILFVGDKPSPRMKSGAEPFEGAACEKRLMEWIAYLIDVQWSDETMGGCAWNPNKPYRLINQSEYDDGLLNAWCFGNKVIALGNAASQALRFAEVDHFKLPHPSGRNRQINDKEFITKKLAECKAWLKEQK